jgi:hypothetical protein
VKIIFLISSCALFSFGAFAAGKDCAKKIELVSSWSEAYGNAQGDKPKAKGRYAALGLEQLEAKMKDAVEAAQAACQ